MVTTFVGCSESATVQQKTDQGDEVYGPYTCGQREVEKEPEGNGDTKLPKV